MCMNDYECVWTRIVFASSWMTRGGSDACTAIVDGDVDASGDHGGHGKSADEPTLEANPTSVTEPCPDSSRFDVQSFRHLKSSCIVTLRAHPCALKCHSVLRIVEYPVASVGMLLVRY